MKWDLFILVGLGFFLMLAGAGARTKPQDNPDEPTTTDIRKPPLPPPTVSIPTPPSRGVTSEEYNILITDKFYRACSAHEAHLKKFGYPSTWFSYECKRGTGILPWREVLRRDQIVVSPKQVPIDSPIPPAVQPITTPSGDILDPYAGMFTGWGTPSDPTKAENDETKIIGGHV